MTAHPSEVPPLPEHVAIIERGGGKVTHWFRSYMVGYHFITANGMCYYFHGTPRISSLQAVVPGKQLQPHEWPLHLYHSHQPVHKWVAAAATSMPSMISPAERPDPNFPREVQVRGGTLVLLKMHADHLMWDARWKGGTKVFQVTELELLEMQEP